MTMQAPNLKRIELPAPNPPILTRMISDALELKADPIAWLLTKPHPLVPDMTVIRMFVVEDRGVEVYSLSQDRQTGIRDLIPMDRIRLIGEEMPLDVFAEELTASEVGDDEPDPDSDPTASDDPPEAPNGQVASS